MHLTERKTEALLRTVVHDLRQPLGTIEISAYLLSLSLRDMDMQTREHLRMIERQVDQACRLLSEVAAELARLQSQTIEVESRDFTKSETAVVT